VRLARVLDDEQAVAARNVENPIHVGHLTVQVDGQHGLKRASGSRPKRAARRRVLRTARQVRLERVRAHAIGERVDVHELGGGPRLADRLDRRNERVRHRHDRVTAGYSGRHEREADRIGAVRDADAVLGPAVGSELALEGVHLDAADERRGAQCLAERVDQLILEFAVRCYQVEKRNRIVAHLNGPSEC
jgi:hypothetical protein